jgi:hypothetical protein
MIFDINTDAIDLSLNKGSIMIERRADAKSSLSFADEFKPYVRIHEHNGKIEIKVSEKFNPSITFHLNVGHMPKCAVSLHAGIMEATAVCMHSEYFVKAGTLALFASSTSVGEVNMKVSAGTLKTPAGLGIGNPYHGTLVGQHTNLVVDSGILHYSTHSNSSNKSTISSASKGNQKRLR